jgi:hypothetical protein
MEEDNSGLVLDDREVGAGFVVQTLTYPQDYELPQLADSRGKRLERAVAIVVDEHNRIKRRRTELVGYVHEVMDGEGWSVKEEFASLEEVLASEIWERGRRATVADPDPIVELEQIEED